MMYARCAAAHAFRGFRFGVPDGCEPDFSSRCHASSRSCVLYGRIVQLYKANTLIVTCRGLLAFEKVSRNPEKSARGDAHGHRLNRQNLRRGGPKLRIEMRNRNAE